MANENERPAPIKIGGELEPQTVDYILGTAETIIDDAWDKSESQDSKRQSAINSYLQDEIEDIQAESWGELTPDTIPEYNSGHLITSGGVYTGITAAKTFTTGETVDATGIDSTPTLGSDNLVKSGGAAGYVSVPQNTQTIEIGGVEQGALGGVYIEHPEWVIAATDKDGKIFYGVKKDGKFYFGDGCPPQVQEYVLTHKAEIEAELLLKVDKVAGKSLIDADFASCHTAIYNPDWLEVVTDNEGKILGGRKTDGTKVENCDMEYPLRTIGTINSFDYLEIQTDIDGKIIEGTTKKGEKQICCFDKTTRNLISEISNGEHFFIPQLDTNFVSPISCKIYDGDTEDESVKGLDNAKYIFKLSDLGDAFNIRVKFKIKENLLNQEKIGHIVKCGNLEINAIPTPLTQYTTQVTYGGEQKTMYWPQLAGGIDICSNISSLLSNKNLGEIAFYIKYTGSDNYASVENDGTQFIVKRGADSSTAATTTFSFTTYKTVSSLYEALKELNDFEVYFKEIESRTTDELAIFSECSIKTTCYTAINGQPDGTITEYVDAAPLFVPYAVDNRWHQVEIVKMGDKIYRVCDGSTIVLDYHIYNDYSSLELGGDCLVQFKDLEISQKSSLDAELWQKGGLIVSGVNPFITIFEGHSMVNETTDEAIADSETMATTVDRLYRVFSTIISRGYIPVSLYDIAEFYSSGKTLPKKCFTIVFDDFEYVNCLNADFRRVFKELNIKPSLAIISDSNTAITLNGETITKEKAGEICWKNNFYLVSHTRNHRCNTSVKLSDIMDELKQDIYSADKYLIDGMILVYPYGATSLYILTTMQFMGYAIGINVDEGAYLYRSNIASNSKYNLIRVEIGVRTSLETIFNKII